MSRRNQKGIATWAKALFFLFLAAVIFSGIVATAGYLFFKDLAKDAANPTKVKNVAHSIAEFEDPLPARFQLRAGISMPLQKNLSVVDNKSGMQFTLLVTPATQDSLSADDQLKLSSAFTVTDTTQGTMLVGGCNMPYVVGKMTDNPKGYELVGIVKPTNKTCIITVLAYSKKGKPIDMEAVKAFLGTIKSF